MRALTKAMKERAEIPDLRAEVVGAIQRLTVAVAEKIVILDHDVVEAINRLMRVQEWLTAVTGQTEHELGRISEPPVRAHMGYE
jgi:hypothetical protein